MGFSGKSFVVNNGTHSGSNCFQQDRDAGTKILASRVDYALTDMATNGFNKCFLVDGTGPDVTADLPMNDNGFTGMKDGAARTSSATVGQVQDNAVCYLGTTTGAAGVFVGTLAPPITAYTAGAMFAGRAHQAASGSGDTLNINSVGAKGMLRPDGGNLTAAEFPSGGMFIAIYNATTDKFIVITSNNAALAAISGLAVTDGNVPVANGSTWVAKSIITDSYTPTLGTQAGALSAETKSARYFKYNKMVSLSVYAAFTLGSATSDYITFTIPNNTTGVPCGGGGWALTSGGIYAPVTFLNAGSSTSVECRLSGGNASAPTNYDWPLGANSFSGSINYLEA